MATINTILNLRDQFSSKFKKIGNLNKQQTKQMGVLNNRIDKYRKSGVSAFTDVAKKATVASAAFIGVNQAVSKIGEGIQFVKDYQSSLANLQAATGATADEIASMKDQITGLYKQNMGQSWDDLANAMTLAKQVTGQTGEELKNTTALAVTYRDTFGEDIAGSIKTVDSMMKNFGVSSEQAYNLLAQGAQKGLNKTGDLLDTAWEYSAYFSQLGFEADEMFNIFSAGMENGAFSLDKVGDAVKEFGIRIKDDSKTSKEALSQLGFNADSMMQSFAVGGDLAQNAFNDVMKSLSAMNDPVKKNAVGVALFGTMFEDLESEVISALGTAQDQFDMTKNTMQEIDKIKYNNATQAFQGIGRLVETGVLIPIADRVLPKLSEFGQWFSDKLPVIESSIDKGFSKGKEIISGFKDSIGWAKDNADWLIPTITGLTSAIAAQKVIGTISKMYKTWTTVTKGMTVAQIALNVATKASPFGWVAMAIGLVVAGCIALYKNWDTVKLKGQQLWNSMKDIWGNIKTFIVDTITNVGNWLNTFPLGQGILTTIQGIYTNVKDIFGGIITFVTSIFKGDWEGAWNGIVQVFSGQLGLLTTYAKAPLNGVIGLVNTMIDKINGMSISVPEWVPEFGGETFGFKIPKIPNFGLGTPYFTGGLAHISERNGGEIVNLPNGSQVVPHDLSKQMINNNKSDVTINIVVQGNIYGEEEEVRRIMDKALSEFIVSNKN